MNTPNDIDEYARRAESAGMTVIMIGHEPAPTPTVQRYPPDDPARLAELLERIRIELERRRRHPDRWRRGLLIAFRDIDAWRGTLPAGVDGLLERTLEDLAANDPSTTALTAVATGYAGTKENGKTNRKETQCPRN